MAQIDDFFNAAPETRRLSSDRGSEGRCLFPQLAFAIERVEHRVAALLAPSKVHRVVTNVQASRLARSMPFDLAGRNVRDERDREPPKRRQRRTLERVDVEDVCDFRYPRTRPDAVSDFKEPSRAQGRAES